MRHRGTQIKDPASADGCRTLLPLGRLVTRAGVEGTHHRRMMMRPHGLWVGSPHVPHVCSHVATGTGSGDSASSVRTWLSPLRTPSIMVGVVRPHAGHCYELALAGLESLWAGQATGWAQAGHRHSHFTFSLVTAGGWSRLQHDHSDLISSLRK